jgi:ATP synthase protein I
MTVEPDIETAAGKALQRAVNSKAARKLRAQRRGDRDVWFGLGMLGLIGWSVVVPTLIGAAVGRWIDTHHPSGHSWTLMLLVVGLILGCAQAYHWIVREEKKINAGERGDE